MLINRTTLNNKLITEQPSQKFKTAECEKAVGLIGWLYGTFNNLQTFEFAIIENIDL